MSLRPQTEAYPSVSPSTKCASSPEHQTLLASSVRVALCSSLSTSLTSRTLAVCAARRLYGALRRHRFHRETLTLRLSENGVSRPHQPCTCSDGYPGESSHPIWGSARDASLGTLMNLGGGGHSHHPSIFGTTAPPRHHPAPWSRSFI
jgi:hypothetical protein